MDVLDVCKKFDVGRSTLRSWKEKWESTGDLSRKKRRLTPKRKQPPSPQPQKAPSQIIDVDAPQSSVSSSVLSSSPPKKRPMYNMIFSNISMDDILKISEIMGGVIPEWCGDMITERN